MNQGIPDFTMADFDYLRAAFENLVEICASGVPRGLKNSEVWLFGPYSLDHLDAEPKASVAEIKEALVRLKSARRWFNALSSSLDEVIETVTETHAPVLLQVGLESLPDEILALIFEYHDYHEYNYGPRFHPRVVYNRVCKRFNRIANSSPSLWRDVSNEYMGEEHVRLCMSRCQTLNVRLSHKSDRALVYGITQNEMPAEDFLRVVLPLSNWEELRLSYEDEHDGHLLFEKLGSMTDLTFTHLKQLEIRNTARERNEDEFPTSSSLLLPEDSAQLSSWVLPKLTFLRLHNVVPGRVICPLLRELHLDLRVYQSDFEWDIGALREFLQCVTHISALTLFFDQFRTSPEEGRPQTVVLPNLRTLTVVICRFVCATSLRKVMGMMDMPILSSLDLTMDPKNKTWIHEDLSDEDRLRRWISAIFTPHDSPDEDQDVHTENSVPPRFSSVEKLSIKIARPEKRSINMTTIFRATPHLQHLFMMMPGCDAIQIHWLLNLRENFERLKTFHLKDCSFFKSQFYNFLGGFRYSSESELELPFGHLEKIIIENCATLNNLKDTPIIHPVMARKVEWRDTKYVD